ncbi:PH domain-containing protein [Couchioplanes caeruleus]|uniref:PH domain-containing protein n=1 Tax=Couchioplanes caeruleus TaxID=56438 RepID=UPI0009FF5A75
MSPAAPAPTPAGPTAASPAADPTAASPAAGSAAPGPLPAITALEPWPDTVDWRPVSPKLITVELLERAAWIVVLLAGLTTGWVITASRLWPAAMAAVLLLGIWRCLVTVRAVRAWGYAERDNDLLVRHGLVIRRLSIVPYARMQFVDVTAGPLERAFQLATVQLHTASAASDARIPGLPPEEAARLRDRLTALGEDRAEGL